MSEGNSQLERNWSLVEANRKRIARELVRLSEELPRRDSQALRQLSEWFEGSLGLESALQRADVLAICLPLVSSVNHEKNPSLEVSDADVVRAVRLGFSSIGRTLSNTGRLLGLFFYPILVVGIASLLAVFFSVFVAPEFRDMFADFGIEIPAITKFTLGSAEIVRKSWPFALALAVLVAVFIGFSNKIARKRMPVGVSWLESQVMSRRSAAASWAWHVSLLIDAGLEPVRAIGKAAEAQTSPWVKRICKDGIANIGRTGADEETVGFEFGQRYQLLESSLVVDSPAAQSDLLREVAIYYWERNRNLGDWWIKWFLSFAMWGIGFLVAVMILSLIAPLLAILSGLTGTFMGGVF